MNFTGGVYFPRKSECDEMRPLSLWDRVAADGHGAKADYAAKLTGVLSRAQGSGAARFTEATCQAVPQVPQRHLGSRPGK